MQVHQKLLQLRLQLFLFLLQEQSVPPVPTVGQRRRHTVGGSGHVAGPAGGKGGTGEPEPGLPAAVKLEV